MPGQRSKRLGRTFYKQPAEELAQNVLGTIMTRRVGRTLRRARIVEAEAYLGPRDLASHASKGLTNRTQVLYGPPGRAYVYFIYGLHYMFNIVCGHTGGGQAVLIRAAEPLDGWKADLTGPAKLAQHFAITLADNGRDLMGDEIFLKLELDYRPHIIRTKRIGVDYAKHWKDRHLRFIDERNPVAVRLRR
ncbi:MAG TPA: DNA-3-methyladenine glycosylase [Lacipirellulaceae bacterium]|nr:DNA-3-methyladenine glycosylase [Lacipirellulaceae bacterium]